MSPRLRGAALALANRLNARAWTIYRGDTVMITRGKDRGETGVISEVSGNDTGVVALVKHLSTKRLPTRGSPQHSQPGSAKTILACIRLTLNGFSLSLSFVHSHLCR